MVTGCVCLKVKDNEGKDDQGRSHCYLNSAEYFPSL